MNMVSETGDNVRTWNWIPIGHLQPQIIDRAFQQYQEDCNVLLLINSFVRLENNQLTLIDPAADTFLKNKIDLVIVHNSGDYHYPDFPDPFEIPHTYLYLVADWNEFNLNHSNVCYFPFWALAVSFAFPDSTLKINSPRDINRKFLASCLNRNIREKPHRVYNLIQLLKKSYVNKILWTMYDFRDDTIGTIPEQYLSIDVVNEFNNLLPTLPKIEIDEVKCILDTNDPAFLDCYLNIVTESHYESKMVSEKAFKPFLAGQIPIFVGPEGIANHIKNLGFDLFYDIIDHDQYDNEPTWEKRIEKIHSLLDQLSCLDFKKIFQLTASRREYNKNWLISKEFRDLLIRPCIEKIDIILSKT